MNNKKRIQNLFTVPNKRFGTMFLLILLGLLSCNSPFGLSSEERVITAANEAVEFFLDTLLIINGLDKDKVNVSKYTQPDGLITGLKIRNAQISILPENLETLSRFFLRHPRSFRTGTVLYKA